MRKKFKGSTWRRPKVIGEGRESAHRPEKVISPTSACSRERRSKRPATTRIVRYESVPFCARIRGPGIPYNLGRQGEGGAENVAVLGGKEKVSGPTTPSKEKSARKRGKGADLVSPFRRKKRPRYARQDRAEKGKKSCKKKEVPKSLPPALGKRKDRQASGGKAVRGKIPPSLGKGSSSLSKAALPERETEKGKGDFVIFKKGIPARWRKKDHSCPWWRKQKKVTTTEGFATQCQEVGEPSLAGGRHG